MAEGVDFDSLVASYYEPLYQFAFSMTRNEADACDLTQETFYIWAAKGHDRIFKVSSATRHGLGSRPTR
jgi:RNA polymerase sigma-70 factor (ECF subfamily)